MKSWIWFNDFDIQALEMPEKPGKTFGMKHEESKHQMIYMMSLYLILNLYELY